MATKLGGTNANNSLLALPFSAGADMVDADIATVSQAVFDDLLGAFARNLSGAFSRNGQLFVPNRGVLKLLPGDWVMIDQNSGWPILVSGNVIGRGGTPWNHT